MKILLRKWDDKYYVWKDATWEKGRFYIDGVYVLQIAILAIKDDNRKKYVRCQYCGEFIKDDPESIERHFAEQEAKKDCLKCSHMRVGTQMNRQTILTSNGNGTYRYTQTSDVILNCTTNYPSQDIHKVDPQRYCAYYRCRNRGVKQINDIFTRLPNPFEKQITVDLLKKKGFEYDGFVNGYFEYDLKLRGTLKACVNELGIVDHFVIKYRYTRCTVFYADNYDQLMYVDDDNNYTEDISELISPSKHDAVKAKIYALYKEATNE